MKALIISDLHSNIDALEAIWEKENDSDIIYCAGDLVDVGPNPNEVIAWLIGHNVHCVRGNHDDLILEIHVQPKNIDKESRSWIHHNAETIKPEYVKYIRDLPYQLQFELHQQKYLMTHMYTEDYKIIPSKYAFDLFMSQLGVPNTTRLILGHTHKQSLTYFSANQIMLNPGSTFYRSYLDPDDKNQKSEYITITDGQIELKDIDYNKSKMIDLVKSLKSAVNESSHLKMLGRISSFN